MTPLTNEEITLVRTYKAELEKLDYILSLNHKIKYLSLSWQEYITLVKVVQGKAETCANSQGKLDQLLTDDYYARSIELAFRNLLSILYEIKEFFRRGDVLNLKFDSKGITGQLSSKFTKYQDKCANLLQNTIDDYQVGHWALAFREALQHSSRMRFGFAYFNSMILHRGVLTPCKQLDLLCDYELVDENKNNFKDLPKYKFFTDLTIVYLQLLRDGNWTFDLFNPEQKENLQKELVIRTKGNITSLDQLSKDKIRELLNNKDFLLYWYYAWKRQKIRSQGNFRFHLGALIEYIYKKHKEFYDGLYNIICTCENTKLKNLKELERKIMLLAEAKPGSLDIGPINFGIECVKRC